MWNIWIMWRVTWEAKVFRSIRGKSNKKCTICHRYIEVPKAECFAHILAKWMYPEYRLNEDNISLVCSKVCHKRVDKLVLWNKLEIRWKLERGEKIDLSDYMPTLVLKK
jgi:hypothetical protein